MRRILWMLPFAGLALTAGLFAVLRPAPSAADPAKPALPRRRRPPPFGNRVQPIGQVVLFSSGVGYFQREGRSTATPASISRSQFGTSTTSSRAWSCATSTAATSPPSPTTQAPVEKTLNTFAIKMTGNPTFGQILDQARGEKVEVVLQQANAAQPGTITGSHHGRRSPEAAGRQGRRGRRRTSSTSGVPTA